MRPVTFDAEREIICTEMGERVAIGLRLECAPSLLQRYMTIQFRCFVDWMGQLGFGIASVEYEREGQFAMALLPLDMPVRSRMAVRMFEAMLEAGHETGMEFR